MLSLTHPCCNMLCFYEMSRLLAHWTRLQNKTNFQSPSSLKCEEVCVFSHTSSLYLFMKVSCLFVGNVDLLSILPCSCAHRHMHYWVPGLEAHSLDSLPPLHTSDSPPPWLRDTTKHLWASTARFGRQTEMMFWALSFGECCNEILLNHSS